MPLSPGWGFCLGPRPQNVDPVICCSDDGENTYAKFKGMISEMVKDQPTDKLADQCEQAHEANQPPVTLLVPDKEYAN